MIKKIIITVLGLLILMGVHASVNIFYFDRGIESILLFPLWTSVYSVYILTMVKRYIGL